jgi:hypothetical protein
MLLGFKKGQPKPPSLLKLCLCKFTFFSPIETYLQAFWLSFAWGAD